MSELLLFDTDVLVEYLRDRPKAAGYFENLTAELGVSVVSVAELFVGVKGNEEERSLEQFLLAFAVLPVTKEVARLGGLFRRDFGPSHGTGLADALIAATVEENGANLVTFNRRHFAMVSKVTIPYER
jgi:predicted nucleic acid-binding protein